MDNISAQTVMNSSDKPSKYSFDRLRNFFEPRSVVLVGAAERTMYTQCTIQNNEHFKGAKLHLVNRRGVSVMGRPAATSCVALQESIDTAFVQVPASAAFDAIEDAYAAGIRNVVLLSSGFAEADAAGRAEQERIVARANELDMMLLGPNHVGFLNLVQNTSVLALPAPGPAVGPLAVVSQSGGIGLQIARFGERQGISTSHIITLGNEAMLSAADALTYVIECPKTRAVLMFMEGINHPERFAAAARRAADLGKPIIVYKAGVTELAAKSAAAHTGALVGDDKVTDAVFKELGIIRVYTLEDLVVTGKLASAIGKTRIRGVGVISASGGANDIVADIAEPSGVSLAEFSQDTKKSIAEAISDNFITAQNPFDLTGSSVRDRTLWKSVTAIIGRDPSVDLVLCIGSLVSSAKQPNELLIAEALNALDCPYIYLTTMSTDLSENVAVAMEHSGFKLVSTGVAPTLRALGAIINWHQCVENTTASKSVVDAIPLPSQSQRSGNWSEFRARSMLCEAGIPVIESTLASSSDDAVAAANAYQRPVALKIVSADILHKSDIGGVELWVEGVENVRAAYDRILRAGKQLPEAQIDGILVSPMRKGGIELIVGAIRDPQWGLMLVLGLGGIFVEVLNDSVILPLPTSADSVKRALGELRGAAVLNGARGIPAADMHVLCNVITRIGALAEGLGENLEFLEINPLVVDGSEVEALDALVKWRH